MSTQQEVRESQTDTDNSPKEPVDQSPQQDEENMKAASENGELSPEQLALQLQEATKKAEENWDKAVRAIAEMENMKKRTQKDLENAHKYALENFARELLPILDSLELGIQAAAGDSPELVKLREGSELTLKQFQAVLKKFNIEEIDPQGEPFNPELHQAMSMQSTSEFPPNTVTTVYQKGYTLNGRLLRPAMVIVAKAEEAPKDTPEIDENA